MEGMAKFTHVLELLVLKCLIGGKIFGELATFLGKDVFSVSRGSE